MQTKGKIEEYIEPKQLNKDGEKQSSFPGVAKVAAERSTALELVSDLQGECVAMGAVGAVTTWQDVSSAGPSMRTSA